MHITNSTRRTRVIDVTSYAEVVLASQASDELHRGFSNLFVETEFFAAESALLAHRRQRSATDEPVWAVHVIATTGETIGVVQYETDGSHSFGDWNAAPPDDPEMWGITVYRAPR